jgi:hypothetical protein
MRQALCESIIYYSMPYRQRTEHIYLGVKRGSRILVFQQSLATPNPWNSTPNLHQKDLFPTRSSSIVVNPS